MAMAVTALLSCSGKSSGKTPTAETVETEASSSFNADSAFAYLEKQVGFGTRVPGTASHDQCAQWLTEKLSDYVDTVIVQTGTVTAFDGTKLPIKNIYGRLNPDASNRVLLLAHYDTRPWADSETDEQKRNTPILGANDGASGVAVMMEIARNLRDKGFKGGIDFLFVDAEDYGTPEHLNEGDTDSELTWCLGTQYFTASELYKSNLPDYAILLDMVGGKNAKFNPEYFSMAYAPSVVDKVWAAAERAGYAEVFVSQTGNPINDDHLHILSSGVPAIDIIENAHPETGSFNPTWHTLDDNLENIDRATLKAVGETVLQSLMN